VQIADAHVYSRACATNSDKSCQKRLACPRGAICSSGALRLCGPGHWADAISQSCKQCVQGSFCVGGVSVLCPIGASTSVVGATSAAYCFCRFDLRKQYFPGTVIGFACLQTPQSTAEKARDRSAYPVIAAREGGVMGVRSVASIGGGGGDAGGDRNLFQVHANARSTFVVDYAHRATPEREAAVMAVVGVLDTRFMHIAVHIVLHTAAHPDVDQQLDETAPGTVAAAATTLTEDPGQHKWLYSINVSLVDTGASRGLNIHNSQIVVLRSHMDAPDEERHSACANIAARHQRWRHRPGKTFVYAGEHVNPSDTRRTRMGENLATPIKRQLQPSVFQDV